MTRATRWVPVVAAAALVAGVLVATGQLDGGGSPEDRFGAAAGPGESLVAPAVGERAGLPHRAGALPAQPGAAARGAAPTEDTDGALPAGRRAAPAVLDLTTPVGSDSDPRPVSLSPAAREVIQESGMKPGADPGPWGSGLLPGGERADRPHEIGEVRPRLADLSSEDDLRPGFHGHAPPEAVEAGDPKPDPAYRFRLTVVATPPQDVAIEVNGRSLGLAPVERDVRVLPPGDLTIVARCAGYATEVRSMRLGASPTDGVLFVRMQLRPDLPSAGAGSGGAAASSAPGTPPGSEPVPSAKTEELPTQRGPR